MKTFSALLLACACAISTSAQDAATNSAPQQTSNEVTQIVLTISASAGVVTAPLVLTNGCIGQPEQTELTAGGKAVFDFTITNAGNYEIRALVDAPSEDANSFFLNVDAQPEDPAMIWDIAVTSGFEERTVSWRGNGDDANDEFSPKHFNLSAGAHKLIIVGREPSQLKSISIRAVAN